MSQSGSKKSVSLRGDLAERRFVLLQGPSSRFFAHLGRALKARGASVTKIGFCPGERLFWSNSAGRYLPYRGRIDEFPRWLNETMIHEATTDIVMLGDGRAPHDAAIQLIKEQNLDVRIWIVEHGYLRPDLILVEPDGMGGGSTIPRQVLDQPLIPEPSTGPRWKGSFLRYAAMDVAYHLSNVVFSKFTYPHYQPHSGIHPLVEYASWVRKLFRTTDRGGLQRQTLSKIKAHHGPLFLFPLQLSQDFQLTKYGTGEPQDKVLKRIVASFLARAPSDALLVVKVHPLDNGRTDWTDHLAFAGSRVLYLDGGDLEALLSRTAGVVTVNSTVGLTALQRGVPTLALGKAVYKAAGLTDGQSLDDFWKAPQAPNKERTEAFCHLLRTGFHVSGNFDGPGAIVGAENVADWLANPPIQSIPDAA